MSNNSVQKARPSRMGAGFHRFVSLSSQFTVVHLATAADGTVCAFSVFAFFRVPIKGPARVSKDQSAQQYIDHVPIPRF